MGTGKTKATPTHSAHFEGAHSAGWKVGVKILHRRIPPGADRRGGYLRTGGISLVRRGKERTQVEEKHRVVSSGNPKWFSLFREEIG